MYLKEAELFAFVVLQVVRNAVSLIEYQEKSTKKTFNALTLD